MILAYRVLTNILYPFLILIIFMRKFLGKEDDLRYKEKIFSSFFKVDRNNKTKLIWFHAASLGELKSIFPIIEELNKRKNIEFLITSVSLSSSLLAKEEFKKIPNVKHRFFPIDVTFLMEKFLSSWKPDAIFLVDSEIWPNLILLAKKNKIPLALINARITNKTFKRWNLIPDFARKIFNSFDICLSSSMETKKYLDILRTKNVSFSGNLKLISYINKNDIKNINEEFLSKNRFWIAASTHEGEDEFCIKTHLRLKEKFKNIYTVIAPRHIERSKKILSICQKSNLNCQLIGKNDKIFSEKEIIIINSYGLLSSYFKFAKSVFIGKSTLPKFEKVGGQSPIEAAFLGCKVYHGPFVYNFREIYEIFEKNNISKEVENFEELSNLLIKDLDNISKDLFCFSELLNNLYRKTLLNNMRIINNFLFNETF